MFPGHGPGDWLEASTENMESVCDKEHWILWYEVENNEYSHQASTNEAIF